MRSKKERKKTIFAFNTQTLSILFGYFNSNRLGLKHISISYAYTFMQLVLLLTFWTSISIRKIVSNENSNHFHRCRRRYLYSHTNYEHFTIIFISKPISNACLCLIGRK